MSKKTKRTGQSGQVAVEYILLLLVIVTIMIPLVRRFHAHFVGDPNLADCSGANSTSIVCMAQRIFDPATFETMSLPGAQN